MGLDKFGKRKTGIAQEEGKPHVDRDITIKEKKPEPQRTEVDVFDPKRNKWILAKNNELTWLQEVVEITWTGVTQNTTDNAPDEDKSIDIRFARSIVIQIDTVSVTNASTDLDINVETCVDEAEAVWDSTPYAEANIGDAAIKSFLVNPGPRKMRLRLDENNSGAGGAKCRVLVRY